MIQGGKYKLQGELNFILKNSAWASSINFAKEESMINKFAIKKNLFFASNLLNMSNQKGKPPSLIKNQLGLTELTQTMTSLICKLYVREIKHSRGDKLAKDN